MKQEKAIEALEKSTSSTYHELYRQFYRSVYATALAVLRQPEDAEDVAQEVFRMLWSKGESFVAEKGKFSTWLGTIARNRAIDFLRARQRHGRIIDTVEHLPPPPPEMIQSAYGSDKAARHEEYEVVRHALDCLPEVQRHAIMLTYFEGQTQTEIAHILGQPLGTVKARIRRGLLRLREIIHSQIPNCPIAG